MMNDGAGDVTFNVNCQPQGVIHLATGNETFGNLNDRLQNYAIEIRVYN